ncbi:hypothetical protein AB0J80_36030 [Actinoplanes sp. NPDC049548]|uniref:VG15 protein n=1 Tax=Actinoplanes sp. NPDC049548 TaxID=3155152 RepID=UPI003423F3F5
MSAAAEAEAARVSAAYQAALTQLGVASVGEALKLWASVPASAQAATSARWLATAVDLIMKRRVQSRALAIAYYQLTRALLTGRTIADPTKPVPSQVTLDQLRAAFAQLAGKDARAGLRTSGSVEAATPGGASGVPIERLLNAASALAAGDRAAQAEAREVLQALGPNNLLKKLNDIDTKLAADVVDGLRHDAHSRAGTRQAAAVSRLVMNGARSATWSLGELDRRVIGYARVSESGTPCGWCAMLISRGAVYKTKRGAEYSDGDKYHDNCHCHAEPLFTTDQYADKRFELNRSYGRLWPTVTAGKSGKAAVAAWRAYIRAETTASAQAARSTPIAQEAKQ